MRFKDLPHPHLSDLEPCAYLSDGRSLFEVIEVDSGRTVTVILEDCSDGERKHLEAWRVRSDYRLVRSAPTVPDRLEAA